MSQSLVEVLIHIVFSTKHREKLILPQHEPLLYPFIANTVRRHGSRLLSGNGIEDHVHLLVSLGRTVTVAELIGAIKRESSAWMKSEFEVRNFRWQTGYGAFSVSPSQLESVKRYIAGQKEHHRTQGFQDEFRKLLDLHGVAFDERYVWD
jgi:REP element-mobilizing transposase RayT